MKPSEQGDLDGACGFYAVVNALRCLAPELDAKELFAQTVKAHIFDSNPMSFVEGTFRGAIKNVLSRVLDHINFNHQLFDKSTGRAYLIDTKMPYWHLSKKRNRGDVLSVLKNSNYRLGTVCIIGYRYSSGKQNEKSYSHWSVVREADDQGLYLLDSSRERKFICYNEIRIDSTKQERNSARPYNIYSEDIFVVSRRLLR